MKTPLSLGVAKRLLGNFLMSFKIRRSSETDKDVMETEKIEGGNEKEALSQGFTLITSCAEPDVLSSSPSEIQESADSLFTRSPKANKPLGEISTMMTTSELVLNRQGIFYYAFIKTAF